jgi:hydroxymethylpyrimidine pyrophosphatase-like HAD family hydrolase
MIDMTTLTHAARGASRRQYLALATDYDGTIAHDDVVDNETLAALTRWRAAGKKLLLVTGREFNELVATFPHCNMFDRIVAENGALLNDPATHAIRILSPSPPDAFLTALRAKGVPFSVGRSIVATVEPYEHAVLAAIRDLGLEWHVIFNKGSVMALPANVTKATGLLPALQELGIDAAQTVGVGDAENDHAFLRLCGLSVAVDNALPSLKQNVDFVTQGKRGQGVAELIERLLADELQTDAARLVPNTALHIGAPTTTPAADTPRPR